MYKGLFPEAGFRPQSPGSFVPLALPFVAPSPTISASAYASHEPINPSLLPIRPAVPLAPITHVPMFQEYEAGFRPQSPGSAVPFSRMSSRLQPSINTSRERHSENLPLVHEYYIDRHFVKTLICACKAEYPLSVQRREVCHKNHDYWGIKFMDWESKSDVAKKIIGFYFQNNRYPLSQLENYRYHDIEFIYVN